MSFKLPDSYRAYHSDTAIRTAVDHILSSRNSKKSLDLPADIDWKDLKAFHRAVLSAHQVRCEYAVFLNDLWDAVWQPALDRCEFKAEIKTRSVNGSLSWAGWNLDTYSIWDDGWFGRVFDVGTEFVVSPGVWDGTEGVRLALCLWGDDDTDHTTERDFGDDWPEQEIEDDYAYTSQSLARIQHDGTIDLDPLHRAAGDALVAVSEFLKN